MNEQDKKEFKEWADIIETEWGVVNKKVTFFHRGDLEEAWQAACSLKQKEIDELKFENALCERFITQIQGDKHELQEQNKKLRECVIALFENNKQRMDVIWEDKTEETIDYTIIQASLVNSIFDFEFIGDL